MGLNRPAAVGALWARWAEIVGDDIAAAAEPTSLRDGVLRIRTASPTWATEIGYLGDEICRRANEAMGPDLVQEVRVWTTPEPIKPRRSGSESPVRPGAENVSARAAAQSERRSPTEALEAARAAWRRRLRGGRGRRPQAPEKPEPETSRTREKGR